MDVKVNSLKTILLLWTGLLVFPAIQAQEFPGYGKPSAEEFNMKSCAFDPEADAVILLHEAISNFNEEYNLITQHHVRIKILKEKGISASNVSIPFYRNNDFEFVNVTEGMVINLNEKGQFITIPLDKKSIYSKNVSKYLGEVSFAFPSVKAGSIIEYKYQSTMKHYGGLRDWYFQSEYPIVSSEYMLHIIPNHEFAYSVFKKDEWNVKIKPEPDLGRIFFKMENIPGLESEPYMDSRRDNLQRVAFQLSGTNMADFGGSASKRKYMTNWNEVIKELITDANFGTQLSKDLSGTQDFINLVKGLGSDQEKLKMVHDFVKKSMKWDGYQGIYTDRIKTVWNKKTGTQGEINMILVNLLRQVGLTADPILVCEREYGKVFKETPFVDQFNTVFAMVILNENKYFLNATDQYTPFHITPYNILNTTALVVNRKNGGLITITDEKNKHKEIISLISTVQPGGTFAGNGLIYSAEYAKILRLPNYRGDYEKYLNVFFRNRLPNGKIDSMQVTNADNDSLPLQHDFKFSIPLNQTGEYLLVPLNLFTGFESNPFLSDKRLSNINFGFRKEINLSMYINLPETYSIDAMPKSVQLVNQDKTMFLSRQLFNDEANKRIIARIKLDFSKSLYDANEYANIKEFYKKMFELLDEQIVLKKK